jgi:hypothetical protein
VIHEVVAAPLRPSGPAREVGPQPARLILKDGNTIAIHVWHDEG